MLFLRPQGTSQVSLRSACSGLLLEEGQWYLGTVTGNGEDNTAYVTFDEQAFATHLMSMHFLWPAKVVEMLDEFETVWLKSEPEDQPGGEPERQPECEPEDPASYVSGPTLSLKDMYAPCRCERIWFEWLGMSACE